MKNRGSLGPPHDDDLLQAADVALETGYSRQSVAMWADRGMLLCEKTIRGVRLFRRRDVEEFKKLLYSRAEKTNS